MKTTALALLLLLAPLSAQPSAVPVVAQLEEADEVDGGLGLAETLLSRSEFEGAKRLALRALESDSKNQRALMILAKIAVANRQLKEASDYSQQLLELDDKEADHHALRAMVCLFEGKPDSSIDSFQRALEVGEGKKTPPQLSSYANSLALAYHQAGRPEDALKTCLKYIDEYPLDGDLYLTCSRLYREAEDFSSALQVAEAGLEKAPHFHRLYASVSLAQAKLGNTEASETAFDKLSFYEPELARELRATLDGIREDEAVIKVRVE